MRWLALALLLVPLALPGCRRDAARLRTFERRALVHKGRTLP